MSSAENPQSRELIAELIARLQAGEISAAEMELLNDLLRSGSDHRLQFLEYAQLEAGLHWMFAAREQVENVLDATAPGAARPIAWIAQQQLRFADDVRFAAVMETCAANESHLQNWLQIFPRIVAVTSFCGPPPASAADPIAAIVERLRERHSPQWNASELWSEARECALAILCGPICGEASTSAVRSLCDAAFEPPVAGSALDVFSVHEILDECIPHRVPPDSLRVLCLRYLSGLTPGRVARHLGRPTQHIQAHLAKARVHFASKCLAGSGEDVKCVNLAELVRWSALLDAESHVRLSDFQEGASRTFHAKHLLLLAMVHDYLGRQLSTARLLEEVSAQKNKSYLLAVEQSLRDIESLGTRYAAPEKSPHDRQRFSRRAISLAALLGLAAGLLIAVGIGLIGQESQVAEIVPPAQQAIEPPSAPPKPPAAEELAVEAKPIEMPIVATVSEVIGASADVAKRFLVGSNVREQDSIAFEQGILELSTTAGCSLVLEGPVDVAMAEANRVMLRRGKMTGLNDKSGETLIIDSPGFSIVDVGTEFGVAVGDMNQTTVAVYDGEVRVEPSADSPVEAPNAVVELQAGWEVTIENSSSVPVEPSPLVHDREFIRSDEVQLRKLADDGDLPSAAKVSYFDLLRIKDLLCYQGFHDGTAAGEPSIGFRTPAIRGSGEPRFGPNIVATPGRIGQSHSLSMSKDASSYLDLDTSPRSRIARTGLVDDNGFIGNRSGELWLCWRTKAVGSPETTFNWAGISLMFGDARSEDEPLFVGQPAPLSHFGTHVYAGGGEPQEYVTSLDMDPTEPGEQLRLPDFNEHLWVLRLVVNGTTAEASVWCDVQPDQTLDVPPAAVQTVQDFRFDRLRLEAQSEDEDSRWLFDDVIIAATREALAETLQLVSSTGERSAE